MFIISKVTYLPTKLEKCTPKARGMLYKFYIFIFGVLPSRIRFHCTVQLGWNVDEQTFPNWHCINLIYVENSFNKLLCLITYLRIHTYTRYSSLEELASMVYEVPTYNGPTYAWNYFVERMFERWLAGVRPSTNKCNYVWLITPRQLSRRTSVFKYTRNLWRCFDPSFRMRRLTRRLFHTEATLSLYDNSTVK